MSVGVVFPNGTVAAPAPMRYFRFPEPFLAVQQLWLPNGTRGGTRSFDVGVAAATLSEPALVDLVPADNMRLQPWDEAPVRFPGVVLNFSSSVDGAGHFAGRRAHFVLHPWAGGLTAHDDFVRPITEDRGVSAASRAYTSFFVPLIVRVRPLGVVVNRAGPGWAHAQGGVGCLNLCLGECRTWSPKA